MSTFALIHGAGDVGWYWHLVEDELRSRGHQTVAPDLPCEDDSAGLMEYAQSVVEAVGDRRDLIVVGQSLGAFTAPIVASMVPAQAIVLVAGMVPAPGEAPSQWWANTGYGAAVAAQAALDGGLTGNADPGLCFYHDVPAGIAQEALSRERGQSGTPMSSPWPLKAWPDVPTRFVLCTEDRFLPPDFLRALVRERLDIGPDEVASGHCVALSHPERFAELLASYAAAGS